MSPKDDQSGAKILQLPNTPRPDLEKDVSIENVLKNIRDTPLSAIAVVGKDFQGNTVIWGSHGDMDATIGLLTRGAVRLSQRTQVTESTEVKETN